MLLYTEAKCTDILSFLSVFNLLYTHNCDSLGQRIKLSGHIKSIFSKFVESENKYNFELFCIATQVKTYVAIIPFYIPYMSKRSRGKTFAVFADFSKTRMFYH